MRVVSGGEQLARQAGLVDGSGRPVRGLPPHVVTAGICDSEAAWRGLPRPWFLDRTRAVLGPGDHPSWPESALALVGERPDGWAFPPRAGRYAGGTGRDPRRRCDQPDVGQDGRPRVGSGLGGARTRREVRATANRLANFDDANLRRSARAAVAASQRVERALEIPGDDVPDHLAAAGRLRMEHRQSSLEELGALANPPMTKDAIAGRIRRLLGLADRRARELGIPDTEVGLAPDDELVTR